MIEMSTEKRFLAIVGGGGLIILLIATGIYLISTRGRSKVAVEGKLVRITDGSPVAGAMLYASATPVLALSRKPSEQESIVLGGISAFPLSVVGKSAADGSFKVDVPDTPGASLVAVHSELAAAFARAANLKKGNAEVLVESPCKLYGEVFDEDGNALKNTFVSLVPFGTFEKPRWQTWTDEKGKFQFDHLPAGRLTVSVLFPRSIESTNVEYATSAVVLVGAGEESFIHFGPSGLIKGVVKGYNGKPMPNAEMVVRSTGFSAAGRLAANLRTKTSGEFRIYGLPSIDYRVFVKNPDPTDKPDWLDLGAFVMPRDGQRFKDFQLASLTGQIRLGPESSDHPFPKVLPKTGKPPVYHMLFFPKNSSQPSYHLTNDMLISKDQKRGVYDPQYGFFMVKCLQPDTYTIVAQVEGYGAGIYEDYKVVADEKPKLVPITVTRGGPVLVKVVDSNKKEIPHAIVSIYLEDRMEIVRGKPGEDLCPGPGTFTLRVEADGYKMKSQQFNVLVATPKTIEVVLDPEKEK